jgi:hypothetical protein
MFCPQCGSQQGDEVKFCKACGANLYAVRQVVATREAGEQLDWSRTGVAGMFLSEAEQQRRKAELEREPDLTPEEKRYNEIKAGVITGSVGIGVAIFLLVFMRGIILGGTVSPGEAEVLSRLWVAGVIPLFVGIALIINGLFVSKKLVEISRRTPPAGPGAFERDAAPPALRSADTTQFLPPDFSVTEETTKHLRSSGRKQ